MTDLVLHDNTRQQLDKILASPTHALLLVGPDGIGKTAIAEKLIVDLLKIKQLHNYPNFLKIAPTGSSISIESIRDLQRFLQLRTLGQNPYRRAVLVEHAQGLTHEAQNAYLKLLEEPPADTIMILTADNPRALLPTIMSRVQTISVHTPAEDQLQSLLSESGKDTTTQKQAYFLSGGLPGLLVALLDGDETHPMLTSVATAKEVLQKQPFERLAMVDNLSKQKEAAAGLVEALQRIAQAGLNGAADKNDNARIKQWHRVRKQAAQARYSMARNANHKLVLSNLFLNI